MRIPYFNVPKQERFSNSLMLYFGAMVFGSLALIFLAGLVSVISPYYMDVVTFPGETPWWRKVSGFVTLTSVCAAFSAFFYVLATNVHRRGGLFRFR